MKKQNKFIPYLAGVLTAVMVMSCAGAALAASGAVTFNTARLQLEGETVAKIGETLKTDAGAAIPSVLCYTDENGGKTHYAPLRLLSETFDYDVQWIGESSTISIQNGKHSAGVGTIFHEEIRLADVEELDKQTQLLNETHSSAAAYERRLDGLKAENGEYVKFTVTNHGTQPVTLRVGYAYGETGTGGIAPQLAAGHSICYTLQLLKDPEQMSAVPYLEVSNPDGVQTAMNITVQAVQCRMAGTEPESGGIKITDGHGDSQITIG